MPRRNRQVELLCLVLMLIAVVPMLLVAPARAEIGERSSNEFYEALEPYGRWLEHRRWGFVWLPKARDADWRPYWRGHWVFTDEHGWLWVSDEEWGWATYHYGRWILDDEYGWLWIPGTEWAPAWVVWRFSDDYVGWAPLPPEAEWRPERGELSFDIEYYRAPRFAPVWCFAHPRFMTRPGLHRHIAPRTRNIHIVSRTRPVLDYTLVEQRIVNRGVNVRLVEHATRRPIVPVKVRDIETPREHGRRRDDHKVIGVYRPKLTPRPGPPVRPQVVFPGDGPAAGGTPPPNGVRSPREFPDGQAAAPPAAAKPPLPRAPMAPRGSPPPSDPGHLKGRVAAPPPLTPPTPPADRPRPNPLPEEGRSRGAAPGSPGPQSISKSTPPQPSPGAEAKREGASPTPPEGRPPPRVPFQDGGRSGPAPHSPTWQAPRMAVPPPGPAGPVIRREGGPPSGAAGHGDGRRWEREGQRRGPGAPGRGRDRGEQWPQK